jgi:hypothetical protein
MQQSTSDSICEGFRPCCLIEDLDKWVSDWGAKRSVEISYAEQERDEEAKAQDPFKATEMIRDGVQPCSHARSPHSYDELCHNQ